LQSRSSTLAPASKRSLQWLSFPSAAATKIGERPSVSRELIFSSESNVAVEELAQESTSPLKAPCTVLYAAPLTDLWSRQRTPQNQPPTPDHRRRWIDAMLISLGVCVLGIGVHLKDTVESSRIVDLSLGGTARTSPRTPLVPASAF